MNSTTTTSTTPRAEPLTTARSDTATAARLRRTPDAPADEVLDWLAERFEHYRDVDDLLAALALVVEHHGPAVVIFELATGRASPRLVRAVRRARREHAAATREPTRETPTPSELVA